MGFIIPDHAGYFLGIFVALGRNWKRRKAGLHRSSAGAVQIEASSRDGPRYIGTSLRINGGEVW